MLGPYDGKEPFALYSKKFFAADKKFGSKDRKWISRLCYQYFRTAHLFPELNARVLVAAEFLCNLQSSELLLQLAPELNESVSGSLEQKLEFLKEDATGFLFPFKQHLSREIDVVAFERSLLLQPDLFLRVRPGNEAKIKTALKDFELETISGVSTSLRLKNGIDLGPLVQMNREVVIQDLSSQRVGDLLLVVKDQWKKEHHSGKLRRVWDCCAASGGKSILAKDLLPSFELTVSDIRQGILNNLSIRFRESGITSYHSLLVDLSEKSLPGFKEKFDLIIADLPCTGSGTWGRTPEQLAFFKEALIESYAQLQENIINNILPSLKKGGYLLYCTCSVFEKENEHMVHYLQQTKGMKLIQSVVQKGYEEKADSLFAALFICES